MEHWRGRMVSLRARGRRDHVGFRSPCAEMMRPNRSEEHTSELQSLRHLVCRLLLEKKNTVSRDKGEADARAEPPRAQHPASRHVGLAADRRFPTYELDPAVHSLRPAAQGDLRDEVR